MKAITTKYYGPTNTRGSRIVASDLDGNRISISYPHGHNTDTAHAKAALCLCLKMGWSGHLAQGGLKNGEVFVFTTPGPDAIDIGKYKETGEIVCGGFTQ